jgi:hypothetical protein
MNPAFHGFIAGASKPALVTAHDLAVQRRCVHNICCGKRIPRVIGEGLQLSPSEEHKQNQDQAKGMRCVVADGVGRRGLIDSLESPKPYHTLTHRLE